MDMGKWKIQAVAHNEGQFLYQVLDQLTVDWCKNRGPRSSVSLCEGLTSTK